MKLIEVHSTRFCLLLSWISLVFVLLIFTSCSDVPQAKWDNPLDSAGTNWYPPSVSLLALSDSIYPTYATVTLKATSVISVGSVVAYEWSADHGLTWSDSARTDSVQKKWVVGGAFSIYVRAMNRDGVFSQPDSIVVHINTPPQIQILHIGKDTLNVSDTTSVLAAIVDTDGNQIDTLSWDLNGDGIYETQASPSKAQVIRASATMAQGGIFSVKVWCKDKLGFKDTVTIPIHTLKDRTPHISVIQADPYRGSVGITDTIKLFVPDTAFSDSDGNRVDSLWWDLDGSGNFSTVTTAKDSAILSLNYATSRVVSVKGKDLAGIWSAVCQKTIFINQDLLAAVSIAAPDTVVYGQSATVHATFSPGPYGGKAAKIQWKLDGVSYVGALTGDLLIAFPTIFSGDYSIYVTVTDTKGNVSTASKIVSVLPGFVDARDNHPYRTVMIGVRTWLARNLDYIPATGTSWCADNLTANCTKYGRLYDWSTANSVCPNGWHLPDTTEWNSLENSAGITKTALQSNAFAVTAGGYYDGTSFNSYVVNSYWWTSTASSGGFAKDIALEVYPGTLATGQASQAYGLSVRCIWN